MTLEGMVKIRLKNLVTDGPISLRVTPRYDALFDINGIADVPRAVANILLGPAHVGAGYELVKEKMPDPEPVKMESTKIPPTSKVTKPLKKEPAPSTEEIDETKAFAKSIVE